MIGTVGGRKDQGVALQPIEKATKEEREILQERNLDISMKEDTGKIK